LNHRNRSFSIVVCCLAIAGIVGAPACARADGVGIIVPSYFYPGTGGPGGSGDGWAAMTLAASQVSITAVLNPDSGPLPGQADPNYVTAMTNLENAGGHVVAYVFTDNGLAPRATVESEISTYIAQYGKLINGFFLDGMFVTPSTLSYYQDLHSYINGLSPSYTVIGNPGQPFLNGLSPQDYLSVANTFNIFEGPNTAPSSGAPGFDRYPNGLNWFQSFPRGDFSNTIFDVPADAGDPLQSSAMLADVAKAYQLNAGYIYVTDQRGGNPYSQLPSYWDQEVVAIASVPEPGTLSLLVSGGLFAALATGVRSRMRGRRAEPQVV
jgi:hypothetical protein